LRTGAINLLVKVNKKVESCLHDPVAKYQASELRRRIWSAPAKRSDDGALDGIFRLRQIENPKRCRAALATALQNGLRIRQRIYEIVY
jgi:hypothetical protein